MTPSWFTAGPALYIGFSILYPDEFGIGAILPGVIVGGGFAIAGLVTLVKCWTQCGSLFEAICLPFIMLMIGVFCLGLVCLALVFVGVFQKPYLTWDSFE